MFFWGGIPTIFGAGFTGFEDLQDNTEEEWQDEYVRMWLDEIIYKINGCAM
jgi:hypothetical protein